jgi:Fe(3+) dicitrate transport protein
MDYKSQQPGGLTDSMFLENAQQSNRARNWIGTPWNTAALHIDYSFSDKAKIGLKIFYTNAQRNSIGFLKDIYVPDSLNGSFYNNRQVDRDWYENIGGELRFLQKYNLFGNVSAFSAGMRVYSGETTRKQGGIGSVNSDFDLEIVSPQTSIFGSFDYKRELNFTTRNGAAFVENVRRNVLVGFQQGLEQVSIFNAAAFFFQSELLGTLNNPCHGLGIEFLSSSNNILLDVIDDFTLLCDLVVRCIVGKPECGRWW